MGKPLPVPMFMDGREEWFEAFDKALVDRVNMGGTFTADDLRDKVPEPGHPNWWGTGFRRGITAGLITQAGFQESHTPSRKGGLLRIWQPKGAHREPR